MAGNILKIIGARIRDIRKDRSLTQEQLAEMSGFHSTYIGAVERGEKNITMLTLEKMSEALEVEVHELFRYADLNLRQTSKQKDLQDIMDRLLKLSAADIKKAKAILNEIYKK
ncbi:MAG: helix-turn-helix transcriptional regulator [Paenibacillaceae bacterium]